MTYHSIFLSVVLVVRNQSHDLNEILSEAIAVISPLVSEYELIVVDNASSDDSVRILKSLCSLDGLPNLQVYALTKEVDLDAAFWVGLENALGDFVAVLDVIADDIHFLPTMLEQAIDGLDVVFAANEQKAPQGLGYQLGLSIFNFLYKLFNGINLAQDAPQYRIINKRVINFILQHPQPSITYRHLPASGGFAKTNLTYSAPPRNSRVKKFTDSFDHGMRLILSTTRAPMRLVTYLSLFGAFANVVYSIYIIAVSIFKTNVAPGWITLSLQQSGMFFLISLVLFVLGEYILHMARLSNEGPLYHIAQEFTSSTLTRKSKLNIEATQHAL